MLDLRPTAFSPSLRLAIKIVSFLWVLLLPVSAATVYADINNDTQGEVSELISADRDIEVTLQQTDSDINKRISNILSSSQKFSDLSVRVEQGLVFLDGTTSDERYVKWAEKIARNVKGVVAVLNQIEIIKEDYASLFPVKNDLKQLIKNVIASLPLLGIGFAILIFFYFTAKPLANILTIPIRRVTDSSLINTVITKLINVLIFVLGIYLFLRIAGLTQVAVAIISGTGVIGLVIGFAFKDIAENFIASLLLSVQRPFQLDDVIEVEGHLGVIKKVTSRATTIIDFDGNHIQIPNAIIYKSIIQNYTANPLIRGKISIGIDYSSSFKHAQNLARAVLLETESVMTDPEPMIIIDSLGSSTINIDIYLWVDARKYELAKVKSLITRLILRKFESAGIGMPDDAREVIFPQGVPVIGYNGKPNTASNTKNETELTMAENKHTDEHLSAINHDGCDEEEDLDNETVDILKQARESRDPNEGKNIL